MIDGIAHFHETVEVQGRQVDVGMAELMPVLWGMGLVTVNCCQGGPETPFRWAWVQFPSLADGVRFLEGTGYLGNWRYADDVHLYLSYPMINQAGPSPMVLINPDLLADVSKSWVEGTAKVPKEENKDKDNTEAI